MATTSTLDQPQTAGINPPAPPQVPQYTGLPEQAPKSDSVSDNLNSLLDKNSPYLKQASTYAKQQANQRGLINTSMAVQAGEAARIGAAKPIAQQDAATQAGYNASRQGFEQQRDLAEQGYGFQRGLNDQSYEHQRGLAEQGYGFQRGLAEQQGGITSGLSRQEFEQNFMANTSLERQKFEQQLALNSQMTDLQKQAAMFEWDNIRKQEMERAYQYQSGISRQEYGQQYNLAEQQQRHQLTLQDSAARHEYNLQQLRGAQSYDQAERLALIEADYKSAMQTSASAADFFSNMQNQISEVLRSSLSGTAKDQATAKLLDVMESGLEVLGQIGGMDLNALLNFSSSTTVTSR